MSSLLELLCSPFTFPNLKLGNNKMASSISPTMSSTFSTTSPTLTCPTNSVATLSIQAGPYCGIAAQIGTRDEGVNTTSAMQACCGAAPIISLSSSCDIYCEAQNQTTSQLSACLVQNFGAAKGNTAGILCSASGTSMAVGVQPFGVAKVLLVTLLVWGIVSL
jgi:hypothetical protein